MVEAVGYTLDSSRFTKQVMVDMILAKGDDVFLKKLARRRSPRAITFREHQVKNARLRNVLAGPNEPGLEAS